MASIQVFMNVVETWDQNPLVHLNLNHVQYTLAKLSPNEKAQFGLVCTEVQNDAKKEHGSFWAFHKKKSVLFSIL